MKTGAPPKARVIELAEQIAGDIRRRRLKPGDRYMNTADTARQFGVNTSTANRAMQLLVKRNVLERCQRVGTIVAAAVGITEASPIRCVHLLVQRDYLKKEGVLADGLLLGIQEELPNAEIKFNFLGTGDDEQYVNILIDDSMRTKEQDGFVLIRSTLDVQRAVAGSGMPAVVHGSLYPSVRGIPFIDRDHRAAGELLIGHLIKSRHKRIVLMMRDRFLPGDHAFVDGVMNTAAEAGIAGRLVLRCLPVDQDVIQSELRQLIDAERAIPGVVCRSQPLADGAATAFTAVGQSPAKHIVVSEVYRHRNNGSARFVGIQWSMSPQDLGRKIGAALSSQVTGERDGLAGETIPVVLDRKAVVG